MKKILLLGVIVILINSCAQLSKKEIHIHLNFKHSITHNSLDSVSVRTSGYQLGGNEYNSGNSSELIISGTWTDTDKLPLYIQKSGFNSVTTEVSLQSNVDENEDANEFDIYVDTIFLIPN